LTKAIPFIQTWYYTLEYLHKIKIIEITDRNNRKYPTAFTILNREWSIVSFNIFFVIFQKDPADLLLPPGTPGPKVV